jgi:phosphatidylserine/phosphatidylglycerophosphate/cardiolipin synthase-like enzyme
LIRDLVYRVDRAIGEGVDEAVKRHHRRRLRKLGWEHALDAPAGGWADAEPSPRAGNAVEILIDGEEALPRIVAELRSAQSFVHVTGWHFTPGFELTRGESRVILRNLLAELAARIEVRVLAWAGAPLPLFRPSRSDCRAMRDELTRGTRVQCVLDAKERPMHCHHEKTIVVDGRLAFVGGMDLTSLDGDRFDLRDHPPRVELGWHDAVALLRGPVVADVADHFAARWTGVTGEALPAIAPPEPAGELEVQLVRTVPEGLYRGVERGSFSVLESYLRAFRSAQRLVYVENQFLWSPELVDVLDRKLRQPPSEEFRVVLVLPADPNDGGDETRGQLAQLTEADGGAGRLLACTLNARSAFGADPVYVHAKVCVVDDRWLTIGSANLNNHSLYNDTEVNVVVQDDALARETRLRLWSEHLELPISELDGDPTEIVDGLWTPIATEQLARRQRGLPPTHRLARLPHVSKRSMRLLGPVQGLLVDG